MRSLLTLVLLLISMIAQFYVPAARALGESQDQLHLVRRITRIITVLALTCIASLVAAAQTTKEKPNDDNITEQLILRLENESREATLKNDLQTIDRLLADNWVNVNPDGSVTTKAKLMELVKDGSFKIMSIEPDEVMVRVYGDAAVVTGRSTTKRAGQGSEIITRQVRFTRVYARSKGRWQIVSAHNTLISQP